MLSIDGTTFFKRSWIMPARDTTERQITVVRTRGQCAVLCNTKPLCHGFETTATTNITWCRMALGTVDAIPLEANRFGYIDIFWVVALLFILLMLK